MTIEMDLPIRDIVEIIASEIKTEGAQAIFNYIKKHPLFREDIENIPLRDLGLIVYGVYFVNKGKSYDYVASNYDQITAYELVDFGYENPRYTSCSECEGNGEISCPECGGNGDVTCHECDGLGDVYRDTEDGGEEVTCPECDGDGYVRCDNCRQGNVVCDKCEGSGDMEEGDEIEFSSMLVMNFLPEILISKMKYDSGTLTNEFQEKLDKYHSTKFMLKYYNDYWDSENYYNYDSDVQAEQLFLETLDLDEDWTIQNYKLHNPDSWNI